jgi:hypothetical protein
VNGVVDPKTSLVAGVASRMPGPADDGTWALLLGKTPGIAGRLLTLARTRSRGFGAAVGICLLGFDCAKAPCSRSPGERLPRIESGSAKADAINRVAVLPLFAA